MSLVFLALAIQSQNGRAIPNQKIPNRQSLRQYMAVCRAGNASYSPNGDRVAYASNRSGTWQLWVTDLASFKARKLTALKGGVSAVDWSPKGEDILAVADQGGDQQYQFFTVDAKSAAMTRLTTGDNVQHVYGCWDPDGTAIYYADNSRDSRFFDCYVMDVKSHESRLVYKQNAVLHPIAISHDLRYLAVEEARSEVDNDILIVDLSSKSARSITHHDGHALASVVGFSGDDSTLYYRSNAAGEFMNVVAQNLNTDVKHVVISIDRDIDAAVLDSNGAKMAISVNNDGYEGLSVLDLATGSAVNVSRLPVGITFPQKFSPDSRRVAVSVNTPVHDDEIYDVDLSGKPSRRVTFSPQGGIDPATLVLPEIVHYPTFDGRSIPAILYVPKGANAKRPAPVVVSLHGGPEAQEQPYLTNYYQFLISRGYAILAPNVRGSTGYGKSYVDMDNGPLRWNALKDVANAVRWIGTQPNLDSHKVVCFGPSYGGFATLAMLAQYPDLFAGGIDFYGPADLKSFLARTAPYRRPNRIAEYGDPVKDSAFMDAISPLKHADRIKKPLLVIQGKNDPIVPPKESEDMVRVLRRHHRYVEYVLFPHEGHGLTNEQDFVEAWGQVLKFLKRVAPPSGVDPRDPGHVIPRITRAKVAHTYRLRTSRARGICDPTPTLTDPARTGDLATSGVRQ